MYTLADVDEFQQFLFQDRFFLPVAEEVYIFQTYPTTIRII